MITRPYLPEEILSNKSCLSLGISWVRARLRF